MIIRKATPSDLKKIVSIYDKVKLDRNKLGDPKYEAYVQKNGFLLGLDTEETFTKEVDEAYIFLVAEDDNKILGYLIADHRNEQKFYDDEYKTWFNNELKDIYYNDPKGMTIVAIAVDPNKLNKGVATMMMEALEKKLKTENFMYIYSIITLAPLTNCPTIIWHTKNGFKRLAMGRPRRLFELDNYSGALLYKKLV